MDSYGGNDLLYLNAEGVVPEAAVIKQGEKREQPFRERRRFDSTSFREDNTQEIAQMDAAEDADEERPVDLED